MANPSYAFVKTDSTFPRCPRIAEGVNPVAVEMKPRRNRLQVSVLKRLEAGLPPTRSQRFRLHIQTVWRHRRNQNPHRIGFQLRGILRALFRRDRKRMN